ncbi:hypothetical protein PG997_013441 [Apiospora hydei]|uniref:Uncharacterized protein n=1 Tax=Apiospora hydei TaxID=1337664 RepID=A0ABR1V9G3_9PEZI
MTQLGAAPNPIWGRLETWYAENGNLAMLQHYQVRFAEAEWSARMGSGGRMPRGSPAYTMAQDSSPLNHACQNGYEDVADYLLGRRATAAATAVRPVPGRGARRQPAHHGHADRLRDLVKGVRGRRLLAEAMLGEHWAMVELLVREGFVFTDSHRRFAIDKASKSGLDSMVDYLQSWETTVLSDAQ